MGPMFLLLSDLLSLDFNTSASSKKGCRITTHYLYMIVVFSMNNYIVLIEAVQSTVFLRVAVQTTSKS